MASAMNHILTPVSSQEYNKIVSERYIKGEIGINKEQKNHIDSNSKASTIVEISPYAKAKAAKPVSIPKESHVRDDAEAEKLSLNIKDLFKTQVDQAISAQANSNAQRVSGILL